MGDVVGLFHPGEMGAALGAVLRRHGIEVLWASEGRSEATKARAASADLRDAGTVREVAARSDVVLSGLPAARRRGVGGRSAFSGVYVEANAVSPATRGASRRGSQRFVDGGIVGPPPSDDGKPAALRLRRGGAAPSRGCSPARPSTPGSSRTASATRRR